MRSAAYLSTLLLGLSACGKQPPEAQAHTMPASAPLMLRVPASTPAKEPPPRPLDLILPKAVPAAEPEPAPLFSENEIACGKAAPKGMSCVPGGYFLRGSDTGNPDERPPMYIEITPYFMDTYEVDNDQYFRCVKAGACEPPVKFYKMFAH